MKLTPSILSIPPYLSTTWESISSIYVKGSEDSPLLIVVLRSGFEVEIPYLERSSILKILEAHPQFGGLKGGKSGDKMEKDQKIFDFSTPLDEEWVGSASAAGIEPIAQHNPAQQDLPPFPPEILKKMAGIARIFGSESLRSLSKPEPGCRCIYCQVVNAIQEEIGAEEEEVSELDLKFREWEISQTSDKLYNVTNPIDANEYYSVYLGEPLGCTCGRQNCEHIRAVLSS